MLRKFLLGLSLFIVLVSCKKVDPELPVEVNFKPKTTFSPIEKNDTAYVTISGGQQGSIVKFIASDTNYVSILKEGSNYVVFKQKRDLNTRKYITAGLISQGQLKSRDTLWLKTTGTPTGNKSDIVYINSSSILTLNPNTKSTASITNTYNYSISSPSWTPDRKGILVNDTYYGGFYIYGIDGSYLSSGSSYNVSSYSNTRFSLDGKAIYGSSSRGGYYVKDYNTKANIILPISVSNSSVYALAVGSTSDNIAYVTYSGGYYRLYHYKNGVTTSISTSYYLFTDIAVSPNGQYVAYVLKDGSTPYLRLYNRTSSYSATVDYLYNNGYNLRSPSFNPASDQLAYSVQYGYYSNTRSNESIVVYTIKSDTYNIMTSGQQPGW